MKYIYRNEKDRKSSSRKPTCAHAVKSNIIYVLCIYSSLLRMIKAAGAAYLIYMYICIYIYIYVFRHSRHVHTCIHTCIKYRLSINNIFFFFRSESEKLLLMMLLSYYFIPTSKNLNLLCRVLYMWR